MKLLNLTLKNFKGCKRLELRPEGQDVRIFGDNSTFKTTIFDAFTWLLFDKDSNNRTDFAIKTLDKEGNVQHHLDHEVEGVFKVDGDTLELKKIYREKWVKRRGAAHQEFDGHEVDHFIDGVPVKKGEYTARVEQLAKEDRFKLLTSPVYFNEFLHWEDRRRILLDVCGDVSDADVIKANQELAGLPKILGKRSIDDHRTVIMARRAEINKELNRLPVRIDEAHQGLPDISAIENPTAVEKDLSKLAEQKAAKEQELADLLGGDNTAEIRKQISEIEAQLLDLETTFKRQHAKQAGEIEAKIKECHTSIQDIQHRLSLRKVDLEHGQKAVANFQTSIEKLRDDWHKVNAEQLELAVEDTCPTCGQGLPAEMVQAARDKAISDFNNSKATRLNEINKAGKIAKADLEETLSTIKSLEGLAQELEGKLEVLAEDNAALQADLAKHNATHEDYKEQDGYKALVAKKDKLQKQLDGEQVDLTPEKERIESELQTIKDAEAAVLEAKANLKLHEQGKRRVAELKAQESELAAEFEKLEHQLYLMDEFVKTKVGLLTEKINEKFELARFKLFEIQINGAVNEICETTYNGVPWNSLNNGARINVGLDIINTLSEHYGFAPPIFVDNAEAVTALTPVEAQLISLIVSEKDKTLRVEGTGKVEPLLMQQSSLFEEAI